MSFFEKIKKSVSGVSVDRVSQIENGKVAAVVSAIEPEKAPLEIVEAMAGDIKPVEPERIAAEAVSAKVTGESELSTTQILEWAVEAEDQAAKHGYKFARMELQRLLSAANEHERDERAKFIEIVAELQALQAL